MKLLKPLFLIAVAIGFFFWYINPTYVSVTELQAVGDEYDAAIKRAQEVGVKFDTLVNNYHTVDSDDLARLQKILPDNVDTVKLAVDIDALAAQYRAGISEIDIKTEEAGTLGKHYQAVTMNFMVTMTYENFLRFLADIEQSLRVSDVSSVAFSSEEAVAGGYQYNVSLKTYWLK